MHATLLCGVTDIRSNIRTVFWCPVIRILLCISAAITPTNCDISILGLIGIPATFIIQYRGPGRRPGLCLQAMTSIQKHFLPF
jgi:hypothetical protein